MTKTELLKIAKPILFNTDMVRAILDGRKTVTRRVVKPSKEWNFIDRSFLDGELDEFTMASHDEMEFVKSANPKYKKGDILYVRETYYRTYHHQYGKNFYRADGEEIQMPTICGDTVTYGKADGLKWKPSIHMPKSAARIFLKVTDVRVERLQDITIDDCRREGCCSSDCLQTGKHSENCKCDTYFANLWNSTIKKQDLDKYGWNANPWVWVYEFERVECDESKIENVFKAVFLGKFYNR